MSRFAEYDGNDSGEFNPWDGWYARAMSSRKTNSSLKEFAAHLDAMPVRLIALDKFYDSMTGSACTVGEFARMRGMTPERMLAFQEDIEEELEEHGGQGNYTLDSATVVAGEEAGLAATIAWTLGSNNDGLVSREEPAEGPPVHCTDHYPWTKMGRGHGPPSRHFRGYPVARILLSEEERWVEVRRFVARLIRESEGAMSYAQMRKHNRELAKRKKERLAS